MYPHTLRRPARLTRRRGRRLLLLSSVVAGLFVAGLFRLTTQLVSAGTLEAVMSAAPSRIVPRVSLEPLTPLRVPGHASADQPAEAPAGASAPPGLPPSQPVASTASGLRTQVGAVLGNLPSGSSAVFQDLNGADRAERNAAAQVVAASVIKLPIAIETLRQVSAGTLHAGATFTVRKEDVVGGTGILRGEIGKTLTLQQIVDTTITYSDNVGANLMLRAVGGMDVVNRTLDGLGFRQTRVRRYLMDTQAEQRGIENTASAAEIADMLAQAYRGQLVSASVSREIMRVLKLRGQQTDPTLDFIGRELSPRPTLAHINGELAGVRNDAGIIDTGSRAYVLSVFVHDPGHDAASERAIASASGAIYRL